MIVSHELSCSPTISGFTACRGCFFYESGKGCTSKADCWIEKAALYGNGSGRKRTRPLNTHPNSEFFPDAKGRKRAKKSAAPDAATSETAKDNHLPQL